MACQSTKRGRGVLPVALFMLLALLVVGCRRGREEGVVSYFVAYALLDGTDKSARVDMTADLQNPFDVPLDEVKLEIRFVDGTTEVLDFGRVGPAASAGQYRAFPVKGAVSEGAFLGGSAETFMGDGELRFVFCAHVEKATLRFLREKAPVERDVTAEINAVLPASFRQTSAYIEGEHARRRKALEKLSASSDEKAP